MDPRQAAIDRVDSLIHDWCSMPVDVCLCAPRPLPEPKPSPTVKAIQSFGKAESLRAAREPGPGPVTPERPQEVADGESGPIPGPVCNLFPTSKAGAA